MYKPNYRDARVKKRVIRALAYVNQNLDSVESTELMHTEIKRQIGNYTPGTLSHFIWKELFIRVSNYSTGLFAVDGTELFKARPNGYVLNLVGFKKLHDAIGNPELKCSIDYIPSFAKVDKARRNAIELKKMVESGDFVYKDSAFRLWNSLQNIHKRAKKQFWNENGYFFNYDIQVCAPTLLLSLALKFGQHPCLPLRLAPIKHFIDNRAFYRSRVATLAQISEADAKCLINSLFNGGRLAANLYYTTFEIVNESPEAIAALRRDPLVKSLINSIKFIWTEIKLGLQRGTFFGQYKYDFPIRKVISPTDKWSLYFFLKRQVMDVIIDCAMKYEARIFREQNGFISDKELDLDEIMQSVKNKTGFLINITSIWQ